MRVEWKKEWTHRIRVQAGENNGLREVGNTGEDENRGLRSDRCLQCCPFWPTQCPHSFSVHMLRYIQKIWCPLVLSSLVLITLPWRIRSDIWPLLLWLSFPQSFQFSSQIALHSTVCWCFVRLLSFTCEGPSSTCLWWRWGRCMQRSSACAQHFRSAQYICVILDKETCFALCFRIVRCILVKQACREKAKRKGALWKARDLIGLQHEVNEIKMVNCTHWHTNDCYNLEE